MTYNKTSNTLSYLVLVISIFCSCNGMKHNNTQSDYFQMRKTFNEHTEDFSNLRMHIKQIVSVNQKVRFEYKRSTKECSISVRSFNKETLQPIYPIRSFEKMAIHSEKMDSVLRILNWTKNDLDLIVKTCQVLNCEGFMSKGPYPDKPFVVTHISHSSELVHCSYMFYDRALSSKELRAYKSKGYKVLHKDVLMFCDYPL